MSGDVWRHLTAINAIELCILLSMPNHRVPESVMKDPVTWLYPAA